MFPSKRISCLPLLTLLFMIQCTDSNQDAHVESLKRAPRVKRVIGGTNIRAGEWPFLVHLWGKVKYGSWWRRGRVNYYCGGTLIHKRFVITAAHCFQSQGIRAEAMNPNYWHARAGQTESDHSTIDSVVSWFGKVVNRDDWVNWNVHADKIFLHPGYDEDNQWKDDVAVIRLERDLPVDTDPNIGVARLPESSDGDWPTDGSNCTFLGWGCNRHGGGVVNDGQKVVLPKVSSVSCALRYGLGTNIGRRMCAGGHSNRAGICPGDSGGPLVCRKNNDWCMAGIASFTHFEDPGSYPGVFTKVSEYRNWIDSVIRLNS